MRILAVPRDDNDVIEEERARLSRWAPSAGWTYFEYVDVLDLLSRVTDLQSATIAEIEIVAHGNPFTCDDVSVGNAAVVGESLRRIAGVSDATAVYLSGCNTGLELTGECVARSFAGAFKAPVLGARGYITGTRAERNEHCVASFQLDGIAYHAYPGGCDADGDEVWNRFGPSPTRTGGEYMEIKIATSGFRAVNLSETEGRKLRAAVEKIVSTPAARSARMRMAPDLTFALRLADGEHVFELLAGGTVLRDPVTKNVWQFDQGREFLQSLLPYRKLPAA